MSHPVGLLRVLSLTLLCLGLCFGASNWRIGQANRVWEMALQAVAAKPSDNRRAIDLYESVAPTLDWHPGFLADYARSLRSEGRHGEGVLLLERAARRRLSPALLEELATSRARTGDLEGAIQAALQASRIFPWRLTSKWLLTTLHQKQGDEEAFYSHARQLLTTPMKVPTLKGIQLKQRGRELVRRQPTSAQWRQQIRDVLVRVDAASQDGVAQALRMAGNNRDQISQAILQVPDAHRAAMVFLVTNMPETDLTQVTSRFLLDDVRAAMQDRSLGRFGDAVPDEIFLRYVLPYAQLGEPREAWRLPLRRQISPVLDGVRTHQEAVDKVVEAFPSVFGVLYRETFGFNAYAPSRSKELGHADCVGGAILLADALRAVGIPARIIAIPRWTGNRVGHAWVEVYRQKGWTSVGVFDKPDNIGWFQQLAAQTDRSKPEHRIYAASFERTDICLPLYGANVWWIDITDRYAAETPSESRTE